MYAIKPNLIIGFHGCDETTAFDLVNSPNKILYSNKKHDWLGSGFYLWECNYHRASKWAFDKQERGDYKKASVVGAVINLGNCLDFTESDNIDLVKQYYEEMDKELYSGVGKNLPKNINVKLDDHNDRILRELDRSVIEYLHDKISVIPEVASFDSVRGAFWEGGPAFPGAGIYAKSHIQIAIRNSNCIKGLFLPREEIIYDGTISSEFLISSK